MTRATTPLLARHSPAAAAQGTAKKSSLLRTGLKPPYSPALDKLQKQPFKIKPLRQSPYNRPTLAPKNKLETIREESPVEDDDPQNISASLNFRDLLPEDLSDDVDDDVDGDSDFDGWDDETTLVSKFQENAPEQSDQDRLAELAQQLEGPMQARGEMLKQYLAHTIAPAARKIKNVHTVLDEKVDVTFGVAVLSFDDACKKVEQRALQDEGELKGMYIETQRNVKELFKKLKEAYQKREQLWDNLQASVEEHATRTVANLKALPVDLDEAIAGIEKKAKEMAKTGGMDGKAKQKLLRELLAEI